MSNPSIVDLGSVPTPPPPLTGTGGVPELAVGQRVQATLLAQLGPNRALLGILGARLEALTDVRLELGKTYELRVKSTTPQLVLAADRQLVLPGAEQAASAGALGVGGDELGRVLERFLDTPIDAAAERSGEGGARRTLVRILDRLARGVGDASDLRLVHDILGHDQEARVLRLPRRSQTERVREIHALQHTLKGEALRALASEDASAPSRVPARALVLGLNRAEIDNARRADQQAPLWLPLPATENAFLKDARMFVTPCGDPSASPREGERDRAFTIVLLLDLTRLGALRVDVVVRGRRVSACVQAEHAASAAELDAALPELRRTLGDAGLEVERLSARPAPSGIVPVGDLLAPPRDPTSLVDVHA